MKLRFISFVLVIGLLISFIPAFAVTSGEENINSRLISMQNLEVISGEADPDYIVTRKELVVMISSMYNGNYDSEKNLIDAGFSDVSIADSYYDALIDCVQLKLINGYSDGTFRPDKAVTVNEILKIAVTMLGYATEAGYRGGWPTGYQLVAKDIGLLKKVSVGDYSANATTSQMAGILYNVMLANVNEVTSVSKDTYYYKKSDETFAHKYRGLIHINGIVNSDGYTNFSEKYSDVSDGQLAIGDEIINVSKASDKEYIGHLCDVFYDEETKTIISIVPDDSKDKSIVIYSEDVVEAGSSEIRYLSSGNEKTANLPSGIIYIYNGEFQMSCNIRDIAENRDAKITLIDNNGDNRYDVAVIEDYTVIVVKKRSADYSISDRLDNTVVKMDKDETDNLIILNSEGEETEFSSISENNVVLAAVNENYVKAYVSDSKVSGILNGTYEENGIARIDIGEEIVSATRKYTKYLNSSDEISSLIGKRVTVYLDALGRGAYIAPAEDSSYQSGFLISANLKTKGIDKVVYVKLLLSNGEIKTYMLRDKTKIDDLQAEILTLDSLPDSLSKKQPVRYKTNDEEEITEIDTPEEIYLSNEDGFFKGSSVTSETWTTSNNMFGGKIEKGDRTVIFSVPDDVLINSAPDEDFTVFTGVVPNLSYTADGYYFSKSSAYADIIVVKNKMTVLEYESPVVALTKLVKSTDNEGGQIYKAYYNDGTNEKSFLVDPAVMTGFVSCSKGDAMRIAIGADGYLSDFVLLYDKSEEKFKLANPSARLYNDSVRYDCGYVAKINSGRIRLSTTEDFPDDTTVFNYPAFNLSASFKIIVIEDNGGNISIRIGNIDDVNVGDKIVTALRSGRGKAAFIYKYNR